MLKCLNQWNMYDANALLRCDLHPFKMVLYFNFYPLIHIIIPQHATINPRMAVLARFVSSSVFKHASHSLVLSCCRIHMLNRAGGFHLQLAPLQGYYIDLKNIQFYPSPIRNFKSILMFAPSYWQTKTDNYFCSNASEFDSSDYDSHQF